MQPVLNSGPTITVLTSCYNASRWLAESLESVLNQTFKDYEFIIVDDGSNDRTLEIIRGFEKCDRRIVVIEKNNTGLGDSLNIGLKMASGKWIARMDADDICEPTRLEKQVYHAKSDPELVFVGTGLIEIDENGTLIRKFQYPANHEKLLLNLKKARKFPPHSSAFFSTKAALSLGGYRLRIVKGVDWDLWLRLSEIGKISCINEPLLKIRKHSGQASLLDSGRQQIIFSRIAISSYYIRQKRFIDPVNLNEENFNDFKVWFEKRLQEEGLFKFVLFNENIKNIIFKSRNVFPKVINLIKYLLQNNALIYLARKYHFQNLPCQLAQEWIYKNPHI
jgi:glycosyltransferase involved in cell wall biosynthesis